MISINHNHSQLLDQYTIDASPTYGINGVHGLGENADYRNRRSNTTLGQSVANQGTIGLPPIFNNRIERDSFDAVQ